jgi:hypothetical protein
MRFSLLAAALLAVSGAKAQDQDDVMATRYGNTTVLTDAHGNVSYVYYNADHTFKASRGWFSVGGTWKVEGGTLCLTFDIPVPGLPNPDCNPVVPHKVGDSWKGGGSTVTLVQGIVK